MFAKAFAKATIRNRYLSPVYNSIRPGWLSVMSKEENPLWCIHSKSRGLVNVCGIRTVMPSSILKSLVVQVHSCNTGIVRMNYPSRQHRWPLTDQVIESTCKFCEQCCETRNSTSSILLHLWDYTTLKAIEWKYLPGKLISQLP